MKSDGGVTVSDGIAVTIFCPAFNQGLYIREALEGFVSQRTSFDFEVIVHDDASTDETAEIIKEYENKYPSLIHGIYQKQNQYSQRIDVFSNYVAPLARGKYIALCEGDDFWISINKIQAQFNYMEQHPECALCGCAALQIRASDGCCFGVLGISDKEQILSGEEMFDAEKTFLPTCSLFYRKSVLLESYENQFRDGCPVGDYPGRVFAGTRGTVYFSPEIMAAKREGSIGSYSARVIANTQASISANNAIIQWLQTTKQKEQFKLYSTAIDREIKRLTRERDAFSLVADCPKKVLAYFARPSNFLHLCKLGKQLRRECIKRCLLNSGNVSFEKLANRWLNFRFRRKRKSVSAVAEKIKFQIDTVKSVKSAWK